MIGDGTPVLVGYTGLTMVDVALTVTRAHPGTVVYATSRHAFLPQSYLARPAAPLSDGHSQGPWRVADPLSLPRMPHRRAAAIGRG